MNTDKIKINGKLYTLEEIQHKLQTEHFQDWERGIYNFIVNWFDESEFILQHTSGSTEIPKKIQLNKKAMTASALKTIDFFKLNTGDTAWLCLPVEYIAGKMMVVRALLGKFNLLATKPESTPDIPGDKIDFAAMVPLQVQKLIDKKADFSTVHKIIIGGTNIDFPLQHSINDLPSEIFATYGMTETCSHIALQRINGPAPDRAFKTLPGISIETGENNCLIINAPELSDSPITTKDRVELLSETEFYWKGRNDNMINSGGIKIFPEDIENKIGDLLQNAYVIVPVPDLLFGQKAILVIEGSADEFDTKLLHKLLKKRLGKHLVPKEIRFIKNFPRNASMKIERRKIIEM